MRSYAYVYVEGANGPLVASYERSWHQRKWRSPPTKIVRAALDIKRDCELFSAKQEAKVTEKTFMLIERKNILWALRLNGCGRHAGSWNYSEVTTERKGEAKEFLRLCYWVQSTNFRINASEKLRDPFYDYKTKFSINLRQRSGTDKFYNLFDEHNLNLTYVDLPHFKLVEFKNSFVRELEKNTKLCNLRAEKKYCSVRMKRGRLWRGILEPINSKLLQGSESEMQSKAHDGCGNQTEERDW